jgi:Zn-finger nucleic acid-binding protein
MKCPVCKIDSLGPIALVNDLPARQCSQCSGIWISSNAYMSWLRAKGADLPEKPSNVPLNPTWEVDEFKICPDCGHMMRRFKIFPNVDFFLDRCSHCNGIWFDQHEWEALAERNLHDNLPDFFTRPWQDHLKAEEDKTRMESIYLMKFGAEDYEKARKIREWLKDHPQKNMLLAFLQSDDPYKI